MKWLTQILYFTSTALLIPVVVGLLLLLAFSLITFGRFISEFKERRRHARLMKACYEEMKTLTDTSQLLKVFAQRDFTGFLGSFFREAGDCFLEQLKLEKLLSDLELEMERRLEKKNIAVKIGPMLGLMGTLIPLGPALTAMAAGDIQQLSSNLVVAFTTTVVGLIIGGICYFISTIQRRWYIHDLNEIEYLIELIYPQESHEI